MMVESEHYNERGAIRRMVASERELAPEPFAIVHATPSGLWFFVRCREHGRVAFTSEPLPGAIDRRHYSDDKPEAVALAEKHNREKHAEGA